MIAAVVTMPVAQLAAAAAQPGLRPVTDHPYRITVSETRTSDGVPHRFVARRTLVFRRDGAGLVAELTLEAVEHDRDAIGLSFAALNAGLLHRTQRLHLDADGQIVAIDDQDRTFDAILGAMAGLAQQDAEHRALVERLAAPLRTMAPADRRGFIASDLAPVIDVNAAARINGAVAVTLPGRPPLPREPLVGSDVTSRTAAGLIEIETRAASGANATGATPAGTILTATRRIDPKTGLVLESRMTTRTWLTDPPGRRREVISERLMTLTNDLAP